MNFKGPEVVSNPVLCKCKENFASGVKAINLCVHFGKGVVL